MVYCLILQKPYVLFILPSPKWLVLVVQERLGLALNLAWNWTVMVDKGSNAKAKTKDKSGKSHWGLFCSPEHWEKTWGDSETAYKPLRGEKMKRGEWGDAGRTEKDKDQRPTTGKEAANETMRVIKLDRKGRGGRRRWDIKRNWIIKTVCVHVCVCANVKIKGRSMDINSGRRRSRMRDLSSSPPSAPRAELGFPQGGMAECHLFV